MISACMRTEFEGANESMKQLLGLGYSAADIIATLFRIMRGYTDDDALKLRYMQEISSCHMRVLDGVGTPLQMSGLLAKLCAASASSGEPAPGS